MRCVLALLLLALVGCGQAAPAKVDPKEPDHAAKESVRAWLRENLDAPTWEETRWTVVSGAKFTEEKIASLEDIKKDPGNGLSEKEISDISAVIAEYKKDSNPRLVKLKFRSQVPAGGFELKEKIWVVRSLEAFPLPDAISNSIDREHFH